MIYITGDTHGFHDIKKLKQLKHSNKLNEKDYIVILGDVAIYWNGNKSYNDTELIQFYKSFPCPILWLDGNHENFDYLDKLPITEWHGGKVQIIEDKIIHLMRGEIYDIDNKTFFCFGGGLSIDKFLRTEGISWWSHEMPTKQEYQNGLDNLKKYNQQVDYILTHTAPNFICNQLVEKLVAGEEELQYYFDSIVKNITFKNWYFGHWHMDRIIDNFYAVYNNIYTIE